MNDVKPPAQSDPQRLPRDVLLLGWVSFFADVSSEMIYPLIPLFVVGVLGASATTLGGMEGAAALLVALVTAWAGIRSDRYKSRVHFVRFGYGLPVIGKVLMATAVAWPMVLAGRLVDRLGKGLRGGPRDALIADAAPPAIRGRAFGFHRAMDTAGAMVGVLAAASLLWWFTGSPAHREANARLADMGTEFRIIFGISAALGVMAVILTFFVRESVPRELERGTDDPADGAGLGLPGSYWRAISPLLVFSLANSSDAFLLLRAQDLGMSPWAVVLTYALFNLTYTIISYPAGIVSDRLGRRWVIAIGWAIYAVVYLGFAFTSEVGVWVLMALHGVYMALTDGVGKALITDHAPPDKRGTALGIYYMTSGLLALFASILAGMLWDRCGPQATFIAGAALSALAVLMTTTWRR